MGLARGATTSLACSTATTTATYTIWTIITRIVAFITHFGCPHLKISIETIAIVIGHGCTIIGSTIVRSAIIFK